MENRGGSLPAGFAVLAGLLAICGTIVAAESAKPALAPRRTIAVRILADPALRTNTIWKVDIFRAMRDVSQTLQEISGLALKIRAYDYWTPGPLAGEAGGGRSPRTVVEALSLMNRCIREEGRAGAEIIVGLVPEGPGGPVCPGIADYLNGTVVVTYPASKGGIPYVLLHEICHIFGAVDLRTTGSVMSLRNPSFKVDGFTKTIIRVNRLRSFLHGAFPLSEERVPQAIDLYKGRQALRLGEEELTVCLSKLNEARSAHSFSTR